MKKGVSFKSKPLRLVNGAFRPKPEQTPLGRRELMRIARRIYNDCTPEFLQTLSAVVAGAASPRHDSETCHYCRALRRAINDG